jgi:hypothetical protein
LLATQASNARAQSETDDVKNACLLAHEHAQLARKASRFSEARKQLRACEAETCPALVRTDCVTWLGDLEKIYPAIVFDASVDGTQALGARVSLDGEWIADGIDGRSVPIDPGRHVVRIEVPGFPPNEQIVVVPEGEHRIVSASFTHERSNTPEQSKLSDRGAAFSASRPVPLSVWVAGGLAVAAAASATVFGALALSEKNRLSASCAPFCNSDELASLHRDMLAADVSLGAIAVSTLAAAVLFITRSSIDYRPALPSSSSGPGPCPASLSLALF